MNRPVTARGHLDTMKEKNRVLKCPNCGSDRIFPETGFVTGFKYHCSNCDYVGALVIEEYVDDEENSE